MVHLNGDRTKNFTTRALVNERVHLLIFMECNRLFSKTDRRIETCLIGWQMASLGEQNSLLMPV